MPNVFYRLFELLYNMYTIHKITFSSNTMYLAHNCLLIYIIYSKQAFCCFSSQSYSAS